MPHSVDLPASAASITAAVFFVFNLSSTGGDF